MVVYTEEFIQDKLKKDLEAEFVVNNLLWINLQ